MPLSQMRLEFAGVDVNYRELVMQLRMELQLQSVEHVVEVPFETAGW